MAQWGLWRELKRRNALRAGVLYIGAAWALAQGISQLTPAIGLPDVATRWFLIAAIIGFPFWIAFAWFYEWTPQGLKRDADVAADAPSRHTATRKLDFAIIGVLIVAVALLASGYFVRRTAPAGASVSASPIPSKSIAVLPLRNESGEKDQQYFSDGLSEDLITALSQFAGLKVISRNSSFQFRDSRLSSAAIGQALGVAHLLEGSVQKLGDEVRVSAELVNCADGSTLWSQHFDRPYRDLFALQDDITKAVTDALKAKLLDSNGAVVQSDRPPSGDLEAWNAYLKGQSYYRRNNEADFYAAVEQFAQAVRLDPTYAAAYAAAAQSWLRLAAYYLGGDAQRQAFDNARAAVDQAVQLDPGLAAAYDARGLLLQWSAFDLRGADAEYQRALRLAPNDNQAKIGQSLLLGDLGHSHKAVALLRQVIATDPRNSEVAYLFSYYLAAAGELQEAEQTMQKIIELQPHASGLYAGLAIIRIQRGEAQAALVAAQLEPHDSSFRNFALAMASQAVGDHAAADAALDKMITTYADAQAYQIADVYALRHDPDNMFKWLDRAWANRDTGISLLLTDPFILRYKDDPRFAAFCRKVGLPTTTDAKTML